MKRCFTICHAHFSVMFIRSFQIFQRSQIFLSHVFIFACCRKKNFMVFKQRNWDSRHIVLFLLKNIWMAAKESAIGKMALAILIHDIQSVNRQNHVKNLLSVKVTQKRWKASHRTPLLVRTFTLNSTENENLTRGNSRVL